MKTIEVSVQVEFKCEGEYDPGTEAYYSQNFGNYLPGDPESIKGFKVFLENDKIALEPQLDVTAYLPPDKYEELYNDFLNSSRNEEEGA